MTSSTHQPHDKLVIQVLSDLDEAEAFLLAYLPKSITAQLDWSTLKLIQTSFIDEEFKKNEADILYEIRPSSLVLDQAEESTVKEFAQKIRERSATTGDNNIMSYAEELLLEGEARGEARGEIKGKVETIEGFINAGVGWPTIVEATGVNEEEFNRLKDKLTELQEDKNT